MKTLKYRKRPIGSIEALAKTLRISPDGLIKLADEAPACYLPNRPKIKPDGGVRQTYRVRPSLKKIQQHIIQQIFYNVDYPPYLQGSIRDQSNPRDDIKNATLHAGRRLIIREDIRNFFPSIDANLVFKMWQHFFCFPPYIASILTKLTTYNGSVPQGAPTSPYIANLIFWRKEPSLEYDLREMGMHYSRFVDDITISTNKIVTKDELRIATKKVYGMLISTGVKANPYKRKIQTRSSRMTVHNLNVNSGKPTLDKRVRSNIRAAVKECEEMAKIDRSTKEYQKLYQSVRGRIARLDRLHKNEAKKYIERLKKIIPTPTD